MDGHYAVVMVERFDSARFPDRLNLGCGWDHRDGYLNVDVHAFHKPNLVADVTDLAMLPAGAYREIVAQDVLEHLPRTSTVSVLRGWNRLLCMEGLLRLRVPSVLDLAVLLRAPENQSIERQETLIQCLFGTQAYTEDTHFITFTEPLLRHYLAEAGFGVVSWSLRDMWLFEVDARRTRAADDEEASANRGEAQPAGSMADPRSARRRGVRSIFRPHRSN